MNNFGFGMAIFMAPLSTKRLGRGEIELEGDAGKGKEKERDAAR